MIFEPLSATHSKLLLPTNTSSVLKSSSDQQPKQRSRKQIMLDAARRLSSVRILEEAFRGSTGSSNNNKKKDEKAFVIGRMLCMMMFAFKNGREEEGIEERSRQVEKEFERWENVVQFVTCDTYRLMTEMQHMVRH